MRQTYDLTSGSIPRHLLRLAAPLIMGNILQQLYNTVDAFILGCFAGELEFAAVGVADSVMNLFLFMITGACTGISVIFAQFYGAGDHTAFRREHWLSLTFGLLTTCACCGLGFTLLSPLLRLIRTPEELFRREDRRMDRALLRQTAHFSFVTALHQSSLYIGKLLVQGAVNTDGTDLISAYTATTRIEGFANSFGDSGRAATSVLVAQNRGAAFENARDYLKLVALFYVFCFTGNTFAGYFNGTGRVSVPFIGATSRIALRVVLSWLLVGKMGLPAVALATGLGWVMVNALWALIKRAAGRRSAQA